MDTPYVKCTLCDDDSEWLPSSEPERTASTEELAPLDPDAQARLAALYDKSAERTAHHEAAHVVMGLATGRGVERAQAGGQPHVSYAAKEGLSAGVYVKCSLSGNIGSGIAEHRILPHSSEEIESYLTRARENTLGRCDECNCARMLVAHYPACDNETLSGLWLSFWKGAVCFFDTLAARIAIYKLAKTLRERRYMTAEDIAEVIDADRLREVYAELEEQRISELEAKIKAGLPIE
jgi:hypothetical protein